jgi:Fe-S-cluster containining protein
MKYELLMLRDRVRKETSLPVLAEYANTAFRHVKPASRSACKSGCMYCCRTNVHPTLPELARILKEIENWSEEQRAQLRARVAPVAEKQKNLTVANADRAGFCIMLNSDGSCAIYRARPLICRGMNSTSVEGCRRAQPVMDSRQMKSALDGRDALGDEGYKLPLALDIILNKNSRDLTPAKVSF